MSVTIRHPAAILSVAASMLLSACGNQAADGPSLFGTTRKAVEQLARGIPGRGTAEPAAKPRDPAEMAAAALRVNPSPLVLASIESLGTTQVLAMVGDNAGMRTYMTEGKQALILRRGMLVGTRGLGNDLSVAEAPQGEALIRARRSGTAPRIMRIYTGDGLETPLALQCTIGPGGGEGGVNVTESCRAGNLSIQNSHVVTSGGDITASRQWVTPALGYVTIQTIRP